LKMHAVVRRERNRKEKRLKQSLWHEDNCDSLSNILALCGWRERGDQNHVMFHSMQH
jgi:hypothetical protein